MPLILFIRFEKFLNCIPGSFTDNHLCSSGMFESLGITQEYVISKSLVSSFRIAETIFKSIQSVLIVHIPEKIFFATNSGSSSSDSSSSYGRNTLFFKFS